MLFTHLNVLKMFTVGFGVKSNSSTVWKTQENVKYIFILTQKGYVFTLLHTQMKCIPFR